MSQIAHSPKTLGSILKRQRKAKQLSQGELGDAFKLDQTTISSIENGAPGTRLETLFRILAALDLELIIKRKNNSASNDGDRW